MDKAMNAYSLFTMVSDEDIPIFEQEFNAKGAKEESHMMQFVVHSALDMIDEAINRTISQLVACCISSVLLPYFRPAV